MVAGTFSRRLALLKPAPRVDNAFGDDQPDADAVPTRYAVYARWEEMAGAELLGEGQEYGVTRVKAVFWWNPVFDDLGVRWSLEDEDGTAWDITSVREVGGRRNKLEVLAVRRA